MGFDELRSRAKANVRQVGSNRVRVRVRETLEWYGARYPVRVILLLAAVIALILWLAWGLVWFVLLPALV